ncbi:hypothetical protein NMY22_g9333 [Coprinellus aureogranulatus]|nr:hypothetical protein NMY22_g9333 [Coprinellus aureogranulatus]
MCEHKTKLAAASRNVHGPVEFGDYKPENHIWSKQRAGGGDSVEAFAKLKGPLASDVVGYEIHLQPDVGNASDKEVIHVPVPDKVSMGAKPIDDYTLFSLLKIPDCRWLFHIMASAFYSPNPARSIAVSRSNICKVYGVVAQAIAFRFLVVLVWCQGRSEVGILDEI